MGRPENGAPGCRASDSGKKIIVAYFFKAESGVIVTYCAGFVANYMLIKEDNQWG